MSRAMSRAPSRVLRGTFRAGSFGSSVVSARSHRSRICWRDKGAGCRSRRCPCKHAVEALRESSDDMSMGLAISRTIIEAHSGQLWLHPTPPGVPYFSSGCRATARRCHHHSRCNRLRRSSRAGTSAADGPHPSYGTASSGVWPWVALAPGERMPVGLRMGRHSQHRILRSCIASSVRSCPMSGELPVVFIIDDDASVRDSLEDLLHSVSLGAKSFASTQEFLQSERPDVPGCIVLDVRLPGPSGLEFQGALIKANINLPIIFISGHGDIPMSVRAMKSGAVEFLTKPLHEQDLLDAIQSGIARDRTRRLE